VFDSIEILQYHSASGDRLFCVPGGVTGDQLVDAVRAYLGADLSMLDYPAGILVLAVLVQTHPCGKT
jgi:hypothetical protein